LVILIALKIGMDLWLYTRSHKAAPGKAGNEAGVEAADD